MIVKGKIKNNDYDFIAKETSVLPVCVLAVLSKKVERIVKSYISEKKLSFQSHEKIPLNTLDIKVSAE